MAKKKTKRRASAKNPAELLLMGANPHTRADNPLRMVNTHFTQEEKLELGRLGIKWTGIQSNTDVRKARKALRDANKIRSRFKNPSGMSLSEQREKAQEIYTGFHAAPPEEKLVMDEPHIPAGVYPSLGLLLVITFKPTHPDAQEPYEKAYVCEKEDVQLIGKLSRDQLYFAGGDQQIDTKTLQFFGWMGEEIFEIGEARTIVYLARKYHPEIQDNARGKLVEWVHPFGEESGVKPALCYDHRKARLFLKHGEYSIQNEGIRN